MRARTRDARRRPIHPALAAAVGAALAIAAPLAGATTASAHSALVSSDPAPGAALDAPPTQITLTFNEDVLEMGAAVFVVDAAGVDHAGEPVVAGPVVTVPIEGTLPGGAIEARWRVVSADGHPISDVLPFTVAGEAPTASASAEPAPSEASEPPIAEAEPDEADADAADAQAATASDDADATRTVLVGVAGAAAALVVLAIVLGVRRSRRAAADGGATPPEG
ncbi:copper resistance CopC family protein [Agrococcus sp. SGAir0287]|uniref:copper resistance CopC family protein n=1 Tax=Agrococcus sp. SGAir0287 TaxID=2070347 RepID=UPI0010CCC6D4|nr:copper resistance CopC family protein [Agrococcus sp. SGAir0287]QCR18061.1 copper resistance protein CopC [Agrococcus sp. SGAir0287]